ncbi:MAG: 30S ribosome-binding factor RbfA [Chloroflexi bacterium]|nr:30S ribosome-binding factor RbfA [Chloroflexota bacterium]MDA1298363.1 30S ribosome-binding factor RbfA [Chloroflexota bacterium]
MAHRIARASVTIQRELGPLISTHLKDPRLPSMVSVTRVELAPDLSTARVFVSTPGGDEERDLAVEALRSAAGHLAHELASRMKIRRMPRLLFVADDRIALGEDMSAIIDRVMAEDRKLHNRRDTV